MPVSISSRYHGVSVVEDAQGRTLVAQRLAPLTDSHGGLVHTVTSGETFDLLARHYYGREDLWWRIADANPARHPSEWTTGDVLVIPPLVPVRSMVE